MFAATVPFIVPLAVFTLLTDSWIAVFFEWIEQHYIPLIDDLVTLLTVGWIPCWLKDLAELTSRRQRSKKREEAELVLLTSPPGKEAKKGRGGRIEVSSAHDTPPSSMLSLCSRYVQKIYNLFLSASSENSEYKKTQPPVLICNGTGYLFLKCS